MADRVAIVPLSEDALNRYRITHSDRDLKPLLRRLHKLSAYRPNGDDEASSAEHECEVEMCKLELIKWRAGIERIMGSVANLKRQREVYLKRAEDTVKRTEELRATLEGEKVLLARRRRERDEQIKCDEIAAKITVKGKTRKELDEQIVSLQQSLADHQASHELYAQTVQTRIDLFAQIGKLVDEVRNTKLPIDPLASVEEVVPEQQTTQEDKMDVDDDSKPSSASARLNAGALPFQPKPSSSSSSTPVTRHTSPAPTSAPAANTTASSGGANASTSTIKPLSSHGLPSRPSRPTPTNLPTPPTHRIPNRPSTLRSVTTPVAGGGSLEEGELGAEEEGEVDERGSKRSAASTSSDRTRSTRTRR